MTIAVNYENMCNNNNEMYAQIIISVPKVGGKVCLGPGVDREEEIGIKKRTQISASCDSGGMEINLKRDILIDVSDNKKSLAILEDDKLVEFQVELLNEERNTGTIYRGKVSNIVPGMQVAFVDIGLDKKAFLYAGDVIPKYVEIGDMLNLKIEQLLRAGQEITVQLTKEPKGTKGARVTTNIALPGRNLVLLPDSNHIGISKNIEDEEERDRLKNLAKELLPEGFGLIMRTVSKDIEEEALQNEISSLLILNESIKKKEETGKVPRCIYKDLDIVERVIRDILTDQIGSFVINSKDEYDRVVELTKQMTPDIRNKIKYYNKDYNMFDFYGITLDIERMNHRIIHLKSGGNIVIEKTEALTVIDVNTGKYVGKGNLEDTVFKTNLEAAVEIPRQLRLRNIGGIVVVDFINMKLLDNKNNIIQILKDEFKKDKTKIKVAGMTNLGLIELTRQRIN